MGNKTRADGVVCVMKFSSSSSGLSTCTLTLYDTKCLLKTDNHFNFSRLFLEWEVEPSTSVPPTLILSPWPTSHIPLDLHTSIMSKKNCSIMAVLWVAESFSVEGK